MKTFTDLLTLNSNWKMQYFRVSSNTLTNKKLCESIETFPLLIFILYFIDKYISSGADRQSILNALNQYDRPQERSRMKKKLLQLIDKVQDEKVMIANEEARIFTPNSAQFVKTQIPSGDARDSIYTYVYKPLNHAQINPKMEENQASVCAIQSK